MSDIAEIAGMDGLEKVIAIDPGPVKSAILKWDGERILAAEIVNNEYVEALLKAHAESARLRIEMIASYGMAVGREVFETCVWIGRYIGAWNANRYNWGGPEVELVYRKDIKMFHCGSVRAKDANIRQALIDKYGAPGTKKSPGKTYGLKADLWAAFALATYEKTNLKGANV